MGGYVLNFAVYTLAMLGLIFFALMIYQKVSQNGGLGLKKSNFLEIEETMPIGARKSLYVVRAGNERFLVASDIDKTSCIAKLDGYQNEEPENNEQDEVSRSLDELYGIERAVPRKLAQHKKPAQSIDELPVIVDFQEKKTNNNNNKKVIRNMLNKMNG